MGMTISIVMWFYGTKVVRLWCYVVQSVQVLPVGQLVCFSGVDCDVDPDEEEKREARRTETPGARLRQLTTIQTCLQIRTRLYGQIQAVTSLGWRPGKTFEPIFERREIPIPSPSREVIDPPLRCPSPSTMDGQTLDHFFP